MRRAAVILFSFFYLVTAAGIPLTLHYCHDHIESVRIFSSVASCGCCHSMNTENCCKNVQVLLKADTDNQNISQVITLTFFKNIHTAGWKQPDTYMTGKRKSPTGRLLNLPPPSPVPIWLFTCSLTYYS